MSVPLKERHITVLNTDNMIEIKYLYEYETWIPVIAQWYYAEWPKIYTGIAQVISRLEERTNRSSLPLGLVAVENGEVVGAVALKDHEIEALTQHTPWLASLIVKKENRGQGIGKILIEGLLDKARQLGFLKIFLYTDTMAGYYAALGWTEIQKYYYKQQEVTIFEKKIGPEVYT